MFFLIATCASVTAKITKHSHTMCITSAGVIVNHLYRRHIDMLFLVDKIYTFEMFQNLNIPSEINIRKMSIANGKVIKRCAYKLRKREKTTFWLIAFCQYLNLWYFWIWFEDINEPVHEISNNVVYVTSKASDQPAHTRSLIRAFASRLSTLWLLSYWLNIIWSF